MTSTAASERPSSSLSGPSLDPCDKYATLVVRCSGRTSPSLVPRIDRPVILGGSARPSWELPGPSCWLAGALLAGTPAATSNADPTPAECESESAPDEDHYGIKGTDCRSLPVVTAPGELGPASAGLAVGTDWVEAYPGSNVWIPDHQISGNLYVHDPDSAALPPEGYQEIGKTPTGEILYWLPTEQP